MPNFRTQASKSRASTRSPSPPPRRASLPLAPSLKRTPSSLAEKWSAYIDSLARKDAHALENSHRSSAGRAPKCARHVHFRDVGQEFERPTTTPDEKAVYHYSHAELCEMMVLGKHLAQCASRFDGLPDDTIVEQGYLTLPTHGLFVHHKRYYCLLRRNELRCFASPEHAAKGASPKLRFPIIQVQDAVKMSMQRKIALFGAHLPQDLARMLVVTKASGERVPLTAETKMAKRNWLHTLRKLTEVVEAPMRESDESDSACSPADKRHCSDAAFLNQSSSSAASSSDVPASSDSLLASVQVDA